MARAPFEPLATYGDLAVALADMDRAKWPEAAQPRRRALMGMPHGQRPHELAQSLYALAKSGVDLGPEGFVVLGQAAEMTARFQSTAIGQDGRARAIEAYARRRRGERDAPGSAEGDPAVEPAWAAALWGVEEADLDGLQPSA